MKNKYIFCIALTIAIVFINALTYADSTINVTIHYLSASDSAVTVSGSFDASAGSNVALKILKKDSDSNNFNEKDCCYLGQKEFNTGSYSFDDIQFNQPTGVYIAYIRTVNETQPVIKEFLHITASEVKKIENQINSAEDANLVKDMIQNNRETFFLRVNSFYYDLTDDSKTKIAERIVNHDGLYTLDGVVDEINRCSVLMKYYETSDNDFFVSNIEQTGITSVEEYADFLKLGETEKGEVVSYLLNDKLLEQDMICLKFRDGFHFYKFSNAVNVNQINGILSKALPIWGFPEHKYLSLSNTRKIDEALFGKTYKSIALLINDINSNIDLIPSGGGSGDGGGGGRRIKSPAGSVSVSVSGVSPENTNTVKEEKIFNDINETHWSFESVKALYKNGYINGDENGNYRPELSITREEFVKIAISAFSLLDESAASSFNDVIDSNWSYKYISSAKENGIISGKSEKEFEPKAMITREEAAYILFKTIKFKNIILTKQNKESEFKDSGEISEYAKASLLSLYYAGIINGYEDGNFKPKNQISRAETAVMILNILRKIN